MLHIRRADPSAPMTTHERPEVFPDHLEPETKDEAFELLPCLALADAKKQTPSAETAPM